MKLQYKSQTNFKISLKSKIILSYINKCIVIYMIEKIIFLYKYKKIKLKRKIKKIIFIKKYFSHLIYV